MTPDELKSIPKGQFVVMKTGTHPMWTRLRLFLEWGISFEEPYLLSEKAQRAVAYASRQELERVIQESILREPLPPPTPVEQKSSYTARSRSAYAQRISAGYPQEERSDIRTKEE